MSRQRRPRQKKKNLGTLSEPYWASLGPCHRFPCKSLGMLEPCWNPCRDLFGSFVGILSPFSLVNRRNWNLVWTCWDLVGALTVSLANRTASFANRRAYNLANVSNTWTSKPQATSHWGDPVGETNFWTGFRTPFCGHPQEPVLLEGSKWHLAFLEQGLPELPSLGRPRHAISLVRQIHRRVWLCL